MGYYVSHMIGIRTGGVLSGVTDMKDLRRRVIAIVEELEKSDDHYANIHYDKERNWIYSMSRELRAHKGSYVVIAGVFNYWRGEAVDEFCKRLSKAFGTEVLHMEWNEETGETRHNVWLGGMLKQDVHEHPIGEILRRVT